MVSSKAFIYLLLNVEDSSFVQFLVLPGRPEPGTANGLHITDFNVVPGNLMLRQLDDLIL